MKIDAGTLAVLENCRVDRQLIFLPPAQLERKAYEAVNKVLEAIGGKWNKKSKGHVFEDDPAERLDQAILTGDVVDLRKQFQFFETPPGLAADMALVANLQPTDDALEPSAGKGRLAIAMRKYQFRALTMYELSMTNYQFVCGMGLGTIFHEDFMTARIPAGITDKIVMNPPFTRQQDIDHITKAYSLLAKGGKLVAICSESPFFRDNEKSDRFRKLIDKRGHSEKLAEGTFNVSGTGVNTRMVVLNA